MKKIILAIIVATILMGVAGACIEVPPPGEPPIITPIEPPVENNTTTVDVPDEPKKPDERVEPKTIPMKCTQ